jgi:bifunctional polynucleotide phosphatase/kinase
VIISNQAGLTLHPDPKAKTPAANKARVQTFKTKVNSVLSQLDFPITIYAATEKDNYRKPRPGMWNELLEEYDIDFSSGSEDLEASFFVGDAGGRLAGNGMAKDFACSDR